MEQGSVEVFFFNGFNGRLEVFNLSFEDFNARFSGSFFFLDFIKGFFEGFIGVSNISFFGVFLGFFESSFNFSGHGIDFFSFFKEFFSFFFDVFGGFIVIVNGFFDLFSNFSNFFFVSLESG